MDEKSLLGLLLRESVAFTRESGEAVSYGSEDHISELDDLVKKLQNIKSSLKRGSDRHKNRKEIHRIQGAIESLRFLSRKAHRAGVASGMITEGGLKLGPEDRYELTPDIVFRTIDLYVSLIEIWNAFLIRNGHEPVVPVRPVGSVSYYKKDLEANSDMTYGDVDYLVAFPIESQDPQNESERRQAERDTNRKYEKLFVEFLNSDRPSIVDIEKTLIGKTPLMVIMRLPDQKLVQVDTVVTFPRYSDWMRGRYTPEHGLKGYTIGNLYKALGDYLVMSISTEGVIVRSQGAERVPSRFSRRKGVQTSNISTNIKEFLRDIARHIIRKSDIEEDHFLSENPGVDPEKVSIAGLARGIKGLANTLDAYGEYEKIDMLNSIKAFYSDGLRKNVESKKSRGLDEASYKKLLELNKTVLAIVSKEFGL